MIGITNIKTFRVNTKLYKDKKHLRDSVSAFPWSHQGLNLGPPDYESGATNQLSYRTGLQCGSEWLPNHTANIILFFIYPIS